MQNGHQLVRLCDLDLYYFDADGFALATASYRLHPHIEILKQPPSGTAQKFAECFSPGVISVVDDGAG